MHVFICPKSTHTLTNNNYSFAEIYITKICVTREYQQKDYEKIGNTVDDLAS